MLKRNLVSYALIGLSLSGASNAANFPVSDAAGLIAAINTANSNAQDDVIDLQGNTITLSVVDNNVNGPNGLPAILSDSSHTLLIQNGIIARNSVGMIPEFRHIEVSGGANLTVDHVIFTNGLIIGDGQDTPLNYAASIYNDGTLTILNSTFYQNNAARGGAVFNHAGYIPVITHSFFIENANGAIANQAQIDLIESTQFIDNTSTTDAGALSVFASTINIINNSTFEGNSAVNGGAINLGGPNPQIGTISNSTFNNNIATGNGGAIGDSSSTENGVVGQIYNSTFYQNSAVRGGAIYFFSTSTGIYNSTFTNNTASTQAGGLYFSVFFDEEECEEFIPPTTLDLWSTVIANNQSPSSPDAYITPYFPGVEGFNLIGDNTGSNIQAGNPNANQSQVGTSSEPIDALLAPLADNGGPTKTQALLQNSPAYNRGANILDLEFDERGYPRVENGQADVGAYESFQPEPRKKRHHENGGSDHGANTVGFVPNVFPPAAIPPVAGPVATDDFQKGSPTAIADKGHSNHEPNESHKSSGCSGTDAPSFMMVFGAMVALIARRQKKKA